MKITTPSDRCLLAHSLRKEGATLKQIGEILGVTVGRVQAMLRTVEERQPISNIAPDSILNLEIPIQAHNVLMHYHVDTIEKLEKLTYKDLLSFKNIGVTYATAILKEYTNYTLKQQAENNAEV